MTVSLTPNIYTNIRTGGDDYGAAGSCLLSVPHKATFTATWMKAERSASITSVGEPNIKDDTREDDARLYNSLTRENGDIIADGHHMLTPYSTQNTTNGSKEHNRYSTSKSKQTSISFPSIRESMQIVKWNYSGVDIHQMLHKEPPKSSKYQYSLKKNWKTLLHHLIFHILVPILIACITIFLPLNPIHHDFVAANIPFLFVFLSALSITYALMQYPW